MDAAQLTAACLALTGAGQEWPFPDPDVSVFKVGGKVFAISRLKATPLQVSLKCDPDLAVQFRLSYPAVNPGYHLNKRHWNTVTLDRSLDTDLVIQMIEDSYDLVVAGLPKATRAALAVAEAANNG